MSNCVKLVLSIKMIQNRIARNTGERVILHLQIAEQLVELKNAVPTTSKWHEYRRELKIDQRVADRYLQLGKSWWVNGGLQATGLHTQVPEDLLILEYLCQLPKVKFESYMELNGAEGNRQQVIEHLKKILGVKPRPKAVKTLTAAEAISRIERLTDQILNVIQDGLTELTIPENRTRLTEGLLDVVEAIEQRLASPAAGSVADTRPEPLAGSGDLESNQSAAATAEVGTEDSDDDSEYEAEESEESDDDYHFEAEPSDDDADEWEEADKQELAAVA